MFSLVEVIWWGCTFTFLSLTTFKAASSHFSKRSYTGAVFSFTFIKYCLSFLFSGGVSFSYLSFYYCSCFLCCFVLSFIYIEVYCLLQNNHFILFFFLIFFYII